MEELSDAFHLTLGATHTIVRQLYLDAHWNEGLA